MERLPGPAREAVAVHGEFTPEAFSYLSPAGVSALSLTTYADAIASAAATARDRLPPPAPFAAPPTFPTALLGTWLAAKLPPCGALVTVTPSSVTVQRPGRVPVVDSAPRRVVSEEMDGVAFRDGATDPLAVCLDGGVILVAGPDRVPLLRVATDADAARLRPDVAPLAGTSREHDKLGRVVLTEHARNDGTCRVWCAATGAAATVAAAEIVAAAPRQAESFVLVGGAAPQRFGVWRMHGRDAHAAIWAPHPGGGGDCDVAIELSSASGLGGSLRARCRADPAGPELAVPPAGAPQRQDLVYRPWLPDGEARWAEADELAAPTGEVRFGEWRAVLAGRVLSVTHASGGAMVDFPADSAVATVRHASRTLLVAASGVSTVPATPAPPVEM